MFHPTKKELPSIIYHIMSIQALFALVFSCLIPDHLQLCQLCSRRSPFYCPRRSPTERVVLTVGLRILGVYDNNIHNKTTSLRPKGQMPFMVRRPCKNKGQMSFMVRKVHSLPVGYHARTRWKVLWKSTFWVLHRQWLAPCIWSKNYVVFYNPWWSYKALLWVPKQMKTMLWTLENRCYYQ